MFRNHLKTGCILIIGGAKSGKSRIALNFCNGLNRKKIFVATAQALDDEMRERIRRHKEGRGGEWITVEEPIHIIEKIREFDKPDTVILVDCLTLWISNLFMAHGDSLQHVHESIDAFIEQLPRIKGTVVIVSNEVGMGIVPENNLARSYRDVAGSLNQRVAQAAQKVIAVMAGLPVVLKDE